MEWEVQAQGSGSVQIPRIPHYGSFIIEAGTLAQGEKITILLRSVPDPHAFHDVMEKDKIFYSICGEVRVKRGNLLEKQGFTVPLFYDIGQRMVRAGQAHDSVLHQDKYVVLRHL